MDRNTYFPSLTGVRALAAFMVYLSHYNPFVEGTVLNRFVAEFHIGVTIFFVLSGFLIAFRYFDIKPFNISSYLINRIAKIYPIYFIVTTLTFLFYALYKNNYSLNDLGIYLANISFIRGFFDELKFTGIAQGWSLTVEESFYLLAPLFFILIRKSKIYLLTTPVIMLFLGLALVNNFKNSNFYGFFGSFDFMFTFTIFGRIIEFFIGIGLAMLVRQKGVDIKLPRATYIGLFIISVCLYGMSVWNATAGNNTIWIYRICSLVILPGLGISMFFWGLMSEKTLVSKILSSKLFQLLGKSSYSFYLIHIGIFAAILYSLIPNSFLVFVVLNIHAIGLYKFLELPINLLIRRKFTTILKNQPIPIRQKHITCL